jgi:pyruvate-formate lyase-activating enzyme
MDDKFIHKDEFRLRVLLTNKCNKDCRFCLNDFQKKGEDMASLLDVTDCIRAYGQFMRSIREASIVTFSGGEPGLYPWLDIALSHAKYYCDTVKVVTNGLAFHADRKKFVDKWHFGVSDKDQSIVDIYKHITKDMIVQTVITDNMSFEEILDLIHFYHDEGLIVKLFSDFHSQDRESMRRKIEQTMDYFDSDRVCTRFTGKQINRGLACAGCEKDCVTLKALWYFPSGKSSTCPQGRLSYYDDDTWDETVEKAYAAHHYDEGVQYEIK